MGIELHRLLDPPPSLVRLAEIGRKRRPQGEDARVVGIERVGLLVMHLGGVEAPSVHVDLARHEMAPAVGGIERQRAIGETRDFGEIAFARMQRPVAQPHQREHRHRGRIVGRDRERLLEAVDGARARRRDPAGRRGACRASGDRRRRDFPAACASPSAAPVCSSRPTSVATIRLDEFVLNLEHVVRARDRSARPRALLPEAPSTSVACRRRRDGLSRTAPVTTNRTPSAEATCCGFVIRIESRSSTRGSGRASVLKRESAVIRSSARPSPQCRSSPSALKRQDREAEARRGVSASRVGFAEPDARDLDRLADALQRLRADPLDAKIGAAVRRRRATLSERQTPPG